MVIAINFADGEYRNAQKLNTRTAKKWGADKVIEYSYEDIDKTFREKNKHIFRYKRGCGCWLWKPYIILKTLQQMQDGDYLIYTDAGAAYINKISYFIDRLNHDNQDVMCFCIDQPERKWSKRDALILMNADREEVLDSNQICGGYIVVKKNSNSVGLISEYLKYAQDARIITDEPNTLGYDNYPEFIENRHDQTVWSLLCKTRGLRPYRDPSEYGLCEASFTSEVIKRSDYPQIIESHRKKNVKYLFELKAATKWYHKVYRFIYYRGCAIRNRVKRLLLIKQV